MPVRGLKAALGGGLLALFICLCAADTECSGGSEFGGGFPIRVLGVDPGGRWVVACQARTDTNGDGQIKMAYGAHGQSVEDAPTLVLLKPSGKTLALDQYIGSDATGDFVGALVNGRLLVLDARDWSSLDLSSLGASTEDPDPTTRSVRYAGFSPRSAVLYYLRGVNGGNQIVLRELRTGKERVVHVGRGLVSRAKLDGSGTSVFARIVASDTDGNGRLQLPVRRTNLPPRSCRGPVRASTVFATVGDATAPYFAGSTDSRMREAPGFMCFCPGGYIYRAEGEVHMYSPGQSADERLIGVKGDSILAYSQQHGSTVVLRRSWPGIAQAVLVRKAGEVFLTEMQAGEKLRSALNARSDWVYLGEDLYADLKQACVRRLIGVPIAMHDGRVLLRGERGLRVVGLESGRSESVRLEVDADVRMLRAGRFVALEDVVIDLLAPSRVGRFSGNAVAVSGDGRVLISGGDLQAGLSGPLRWVVPATR